MSREATRTGDSGDHCPAHIGTEFGPCTPTLCSNMAEAQMLEDRADAINWLVERARDAVLHGNDDASDALPLTAVLEAARVLARSITEVGDAEVPGHDGRLLWSVFTLSPRPTKLAAAPNGPAA